MKLSPIFVRTIRVGCVVAIICMAGYACKPRTEPDRQHERPAWAVADTTDLESTMTVTGVLPTLLADQADSTDLVAAFSGNVCWGVTNIQKIDGRPYFFLFVIRPRSVSSIDECLTLRYYATKTRFVYAEKDAFTFTTDGTLGTIESPFTPAFSTQE